MDRKKICPVCEKYEFEEQDAYEICPVCDWEDDLLQRKNPDYSGGANKLSLNEYRKKYLESIGETDE